MRQGADDVAAVLEQLQGAEHSPGEEGVGLALVRPSEVDGDRYGPERLMSPVPRVGQMSRNRGDAADVPLGSLGP